MVTKPKRFETGQLIVTNDIVDAMEDKSFKDFVYTSFLRYCSNDWGDLERYDMKLNRRNIKHGGNLGGRYLDKERGWEIWILTTESRDRTIISFPTKGNTAAEVEAKRAEAEKAAANYEWAQEHWYDEDD